MEYLLLPNTALGDHIHEAVKVVRCRQACWCVGFIMSAGSWCIWHIVVGLVCWSVHSQMNYSEKRVVLLTSKSIGGAQAPCQNVSLGAGLCYRP